MGGRCFFAGHRRAPDGLLPALQDLVEHVITMEGITAFFVGGYGDFDRLAARAVMAAKKTHLDITLSLLLPYHPAERRVEIPAGFDDTYYPEGMERVPRRLAIVRANRYMVDCCSLLIAYVWHPASNAAELLDYARRREQRGLIKVLTLEV